MQGSWTRARVLLFTVVTAEMLLAVGTIAAIYAPTGDPAPPSTAEWLPYRWPAAASVLLVVVVDAVVIALVCRARRGQRAPVPSAVPAPASGGWPRTMPPPLRLQRVGQRSLAITAAASGALLVAGIRLDLPLWATALAMLLPWAPVLVVEALWKYEHYGFYAVLLVFAVLQVGHLAEHTAQLVQILLTAGDATMSRGVFGALDRELVHFGWDTSVWLGLIVLMLRLGRHNGWLWISFAAASLHEIEHMFLFYIDRFAPAFYDAGANTGIMAQGGMIGSPVHRIYLHFIYNFLVVMPLLLALWHETLRARDQAGEGEERRTDAAAPSWSPASH